MTCLLLVVGLFVFIFSLPKRGFSTAFKRLLLFTLTGFLLDLIIAGFTALVIYAPYN